MMRVERVILFLTLAVFLTQASSGDWSASVPNQLEALIGSCVVIPCTFSHPGLMLPSAKLRGIWHFTTNGADNIVYHEDKTKVLHQYKGRTKLLGHLGEGNCTLQIQKVEGHDNGPFSFRVEQVSQYGDRYSYVQNSVALRLQAKPKEMSLTSSKTAVQGRPYTATCSVRHTCPSFMPKLSWSQGAADQILEKHEMIHPGTWKTESILTFVLEEKDDHSELNCTATFYGGQTTRKSLNIYIKRAANFNHIIIPVGVLVGTAAIIGLIFFLVVKKYKKRLEELQSKDGSFLNRMSRMSRRFRSNRAGQPQTRRSIWSRFSRRPRQKLDQQQASKPHFPSPKAKPKSNNCRKNLRDDGSRSGMEDVNIYGNV